MEKTIIVPSTPSEKIIEIPGSKSFTNRALIIAALSEQKVLLKNVLFCDDTKHMIDALKSLGIKIEISGKNVIVHGEKIENLKEKEGAIFVGNSGTSMRFLTAFLSLTNFKSRLTGDDRMQERPINDLLNGLSQLGAKIEAIKKKGCPPLRIKGRGLAGGTCKLSGKISSQYITAILMVAPYANNDVIIEIEDELVSKPYVDMTIEIMKDFGVEVENHDYKTFIVKSGQRYSKDEYVIEGDASSASYFFAISALHNIPIKIANVPMNSKQADLQILDVLKQMGCKINSDEKHIWLNAPKKLKPLGKINLNHMPDSAMTVATMCLLISGESKIFGLENLKYKETDRLTALENELLKFSKILPNSKCEKHDDGIDIHGIDIDEINPKFNEKILIKTYNDHRIAMCFSVLATLLPNVEILNPKCVSKTYPNFFNDLRKLNLNVQIKNIKNIVLTGMRGTGKSTIGRKIAKLLKYKFIDTDDMIERQEKMKIPEIIKKKNWFYFRKKEKYVVRQISRKNNTVVSTGGGVIIDKQNEKSLKRNGIVVFLNADIDVLEQRLSRSTTDRPPLTKEKSLKDELKAIWQKREKRYTESADVIYDTSKHLNPEEKALQIVSLI